jgi:hypothetical protein
MKDYGSRRLLIVLATTLLVAIADFMGVPLGEGSLEAIQNLGIAGVLGIGAEDFAKAWKGGQAIAEAAGDLKDAAEEAVAIAEETAEEA